MLSALPRIGRRSRIPAAVQAAALVALISSTPSTHAALRWDATEIKLKVRAEETVARAQFTFTNDGYKDVDILRIEPGCGCTAPLPTKMHIAPGEKGQIPVEFHRGNREGTSRISITVYSSNTNTPTTLFLGVEIEAAVSIEPRFVYWKTGEPRDPRSVHVKLAPELPVKIVEVVCGNPLFTARLVPAESREREFELVISPPASEATFSSITVRARIGDNSAERTVTLLARTL
jgi:hypothetical protein